MSAHKLAGNAADAERHKRLARGAGDAIADSGDREHFDDDWATLKALGQPARAFLLPASKRIGSTSRWSRSG
jgi:hypothetical protein